MARGIRADPRELRFPSGGEISSAYLAFKSIYILSSQIRRNTGFKSNESLGVWGWLMHWDGNCSTQAHLGSCLVCSLRGGFGWNDWIWLSCLIASTEQLHWVTASSERKVDLVGDLVSDLKTQLSVDKHRNNMARDSNLNQGVHVAWNSYAAFSFRKGDLRVSKKNPQSN